MNQIAVLALISWIPLSLFLFTLLPSRRAVLVSAIGAWLFLPVGGIDLPGLPDLTKSSATALGTLLGALLFDMPRVSAFRLQWYDLPLALFCVSTGASSLSNNLGVYDAASATLGQMFNIGFAYFVGRLYFTDIEGLRELVGGIVVGGLIYVPFCLWEIRMSPQLHQNLYGFSAQRFVTVMRMGGFRPMVFMQSGLTLGLWMGASTLLAYATWVGGVRKQLAGWSIGTVVLPVLGITFLLCKSSGALILTMGSIVLVWYEQRFKRTWPIWLLLLVPTAYLTTRSTGIWSGSQAVSLARSLFGPDRAQSLEFRLENEDLLVKRALEQPWLGWGGYGRAGALDKHGKQAIVDGWWVIILGNHGIIGLAAWAITMLLPSALALRRFATARRTMDPEIVALIILLISYMIDCLLNAMLNPIFFMAAGGLLALKPGPAHAVSHVSVADDYEFAARHLLKEGRVDDAIAARVLVVEIHSREVAASPTDTVASRALATSLNNLAWLLCEGPDPALRDPAQATELAERAVAMEPERATFWNTLGAIYYRTSRWDEAIQSLDLALRLTDDGSAIASVLLLAMAHQNAGDPSRAKGLLSDTKTYLAARPNTTPAVESLLAEATALIG